MDSALQAPFESILWTLTDDTPEKIKPHNSKDPSKRDQGCTGNTAGCFNPDDMRFISDPLSVRAASDLVYNPKVDATHDNGILDSSTKNDIQAGQKNRYLDHDRIQINQESHPVLMGWFQSMRSCMTTIPMPRLSRIKTFCTEQLAKLVQNGTFLGKYMLNRRTQFKESEIQEILKSHPSSLNQESVDLGIEEVSEAAKSAIKQCKKISTLINHAFDLQKIAEDRTATNEKKKSAKLACVTSLLEVINSGPDNEGIRCLKLLLALADDRDKLLDHYREIEANEERAPS